MATVHYQFCPDAARSQWIVVYPGGIVDRCHDRASAETLAKAFNTGEVF